MSIFKVLSYSGAFLVLLSSLSCNTVPPNLDEVSDEKVEETTWIRVLGNFQSYENHSIYSPWTGQGGNVFHDNYHYKKASFQIISPEKYAGREVGVLYPGIGGFKPFVPLSRIDSVFQFYIPADFFTGDYKTIDEIKVHNLRPIEPGNPLEDEITEKPIPWSERFELLP